MRALWRGEQVDHRGLVDGATGRGSGRCRRNRRASSPARSAPRPRRWAAGWADGLITVNQPPRSCARCSVPTARPAAAARSVQVHLSYAATDDEALAVAVEQWRGNCLPTLLAWDLDPPEQFEAATAHVPPEEVARNVRISADPGRHAAWLREYLDLGVDELYLHHVGPTTTGSSTFRHAGAAGAAGRGMRATFTGDLWWKTAVIYCLDVQTFADSNGDGVGDFPGLVRASRPPCRSRRDRDLADALLPDRGRRRRLRHHRLLRRRSAARHPRRLRRVRPHRARPRACG